MGRGIQGESGVILEKSNFLEFNEMSRSTEKCHVHPALHPHGMVVGSQSKNVFAKNCRNVLISTENSCLGNITKSGEVRINSKNILPGIERNVQITKYFYPHRICTWFPLHNPLLQSTVAKISNALSTQASQFYPPRH